MDDEASGFDEVAAASVERSVDADGDDTGTETDSRLAGLDMGSGEPFSAKAVTNEDKTDWNELGTKATTGATTVGLPLGGNAASTNEGWVDGTIPIDVDGASTDAAAAVRVDWAGNGPAGGSEDVDDDDTDTAWFW